MRCFGRHQDAYARRNKPGPAEATSVGTANASPHIATQWNTKINPQHEPTGRKAGGFARAGVKRWSCYRQYNRTSPVSCPAKSVIFPSAATSGGPSRAVRWPDGTAARHQRQRTRGACRGRPSRHPEGRRRPRRPAQRLLDLRLAEQFVADHVGVHQDATELYKLGGRCALARADPPDDADHRLTSALAIHRSGSSPPVERTRPRPHHRVRLGEPTHAPASLPPAPQGARPAGFHRGGCIVPSAGGQSRQARRQINRPTAWRASGRRGTAERRGPAGAVRG